MYENISQVNIELSNICNMAHAHARCPLNFATVASDEKVILESKIVYDTIDNLKSNGFRGLICFNIYNEPLIDPRLFEFIKYIDSPNIRPFIISNGFYLNQTIIHDLALCGNMVLWLSSYSKQDEIRFKSYFYPSNIELNIIPFKPLQDLSETYIRDFKDLHKPCHEVGHLSMRCNGDIVLCCRDYKSRHVFGNLHQEQLSDIIAHSQLMPIKADLRCGIRELDICRRCDN